MTLVIQLKVSDIKRFSKNVVLPHMGQDYSLYMGRDLIRMRGGFLQGILFAKKRSGWLNVIPTFFVVGTDPSDPVIFQTMSLPISGIDKDRKWKWPQDVTLDEELANEIIAKVEIDSPLSFKKSLNDRAIESVLSVFVKKGTHWMPSLSLAYYNMCRGSKSARKDLERARLIFIEHSRYGAGQPPLPYEKILLNRFEELETRFSSSNGIEICRTEAELHARKLSLPAIQWPNDWPV